MQTGSFHYVVTFKEGDKQRKKTFESLPQARQWIKETKPRVWKIEQHIQVEIDSKGVL